VDGLQLNSSWIALMASPSKTVQGSLRFFKVREGSGISSQNLITFNII
jgi:hypothetical protein